MTIEMGSYGERSTPHALCPGGARRKGSSRNSGKNLFFGSSWILVTHFLRALPAYPLPATRYPLPATRYPLPATRYPLPVARCPLPDWTTLYSARDGRDAAPGVPVQINDGSTGPTEMKDSAWQTSENSAYGSSRGSLPSMRIESLPACAEQRAQRFATSSRALRCRCRRTSSKGAHMQVRASLRAFSNTPLLRYRNSRATFNWRAILK